VTLFHRRVTKSGRYVVTFEHNPRNLVTKHVVEKCVLDCGVQLVPPSELVTLYEEVGLFVLDVVYLIFFPRTFSFLSFSERLLHSIPFGAQYAVIARKEE